MSDPTVPEATDAAAASASAPAAASVAFCSFCEDRPATVWCDTCIMKLCAPNGCDSELHATKGRTHHVREPYPIVDKAPRTEEDERSIEGIVVPRLFVPVGHHASKSTEAPTAAIAAAATTAELVAPVADASSSAPSAAPSSSSPAAAPPAAAVAMPMCDHCSSHVASIRCVECAEQMCSPGCDDEVHAIKGQQGHTRTKLDASAVIPAASAAAPADPPAAAAAPVKSAALSAPQEFCDHCNSHVATLYCDECVMILCQPGCDEEVHGSKATGAHARVSYPIREGQHTAGAETKHNSAQTAHPSAAARAASVAHAATAVPPSASSAKSAATAAIPMCASCESHIAEVSCIACGSGGSASTAQHLCRACDEEVHVVKSKVDHRRTAYSAAAPSDAAAATAAVKSTEFCDYCSSHVATLYCDECVMILCSPGCDDEVHAAKDRAMHARVAYPIREGGPPASAIAQPDPKRASTRLSNSNPSAVALAASKAHAAATATATTASSNPSVGRAVSATSASSASAASSRPRTAGGLDEFTIDDSLLAETPPPTGDPSAGAAALPNLASSRPKSRAGSAAGRAAANSSIFPSTSTNGEAAAATPAGKTRSTGGSTGAPSKRQASSSSKAGKPASGSSASTLASPAQARTRSGNSSSSIGEPSALPEANSNITPPPTASKPAREPSVSGGSAASSNAPPLSPHAAAATLTTAEIMPLDSSGRSAKAGGGAEKVNYNYVLYSLRNKCTKLEETVEELSGKLARSEAETKAYADAFTKEQRQHRDLVAQRDLERAEKEAAQQALARMALERDEWRARFETRQPEIDELARTHRAAQSKLAEQLANMEKQVAFHSSLSADKTSEIEGLQSEVAKQSAALLDREAQIAREKEINDKYKTYSSQYESLILTLREKLGEAERKLIGSTKWKAKAASYVEEWEQERKKMKRKIVRQVEMIDALRQDLKDYRAILKYVSVRGFVNQFLLRKALRRLFNQALELATENLIEQVEAQPKIHNSVQLDSKEDLSTRNQRISNEYPWGNAGGAAALLAAQQNQSAALGSAHKHRPGIDGPVSPPAASAGSGSAAGVSRRRTMAHFPPLTACVTSIVSQLHVLGESSVLIRAQKRKWQETADSFFKRNIELTNAYLGADAELLTAKKKSAALKAHTRTLQSRFAELEAALSQAAAERARVQAELEALSRQSARDKAQVGHVAHAQFERSVELTRRVQQLETDCRSLTQQKERLSKDVRDAQTNLGFMQYKAGEHTDKQEQQLKLAAQTQALLMGWGARNGTEQRGSSPSRVVPSQQPPPGMHRALVPATPAPAAAGQSADPFSDEDEEEHKQSAGASHHGHGGNSSSDFTPSSASTPYPPHTAIVRSAGRPVAAPTDFGSMSPYDYKAGVAVPSQSVTPMSAARVAAMDPYRGDSYSRGPAHASMPYTPAALAAGSAAVTPAVPRSSKAHHSPASRSAQMYRPLLAAYGMPPVAAVTSPAGSSTARPSSSPSRRPGSSGSATARPSASASVSGPPGVMSVPSKKRAAVGAGSAEALNRTILDAAMSRAARRSRTSGGGGSSGAVGSAGSMSSVGSAASAPTYRPPAGSRAAQVQARQQDAVPAAAAPPSPPPLAALKAIMQAEQSRQTTHAQANAQAADDAYESN